MNTPTNKHTNKRVDLFYEGALPYLKPSFDLNSLLVFNYRSFLVMWHYLLKKFVLRFKFSLVDLESGIISLHCLEFGSSSEFKFLNWLLQNFS